MKNQTKPKTTQKPQNLPAFTEIVVSSLFEYERPLSKRTRDMNQISFEAMNRIFNKR